jgi:hypothetical protein
MRGVLDSFFRNPPVSGGKIANERSLQLELGIYLRSIGFRVDFEQSMKAPRLSGSSLKPKHNLDLLVTANDGARIGVELKVPLNGQHPETMYAFCADIEFVEALRRVDAIARGFAIMLTPDGAFWNDSGRGSPIHNMFRQPQGRLEGAIAKPTGSQDSCVQLQGSYIISGNWIIADKLLPRSKCVIAEI